MSKRIIWVVEIADMGKENWKPLYVCMNCKKQEVLRAVETRTVLFPQKDYRARPYVPKDGK
jgi:hypothetical protein